MRKTLAVFLSLLFAVGVFGQGARSVTINWTASPSSGVTGYNVYKASTACSGATFAKANSTPITGLSYSETGLADGVTRCYYVTALSATAESGPSSTIQITTPTITASNTLLPPATATGIVQ
jgi:hypothetical protein